MLNKLKQNWVLILGISVLIFIFWIVIGWVFVYALILDNPTFAHTNYSKLYNWDIPVHIVDKDIDGDNKKDLITFTGCAFLTSVKKEDIPKENQCIASGIQDMYADVQSLVGQKYVTTNEKDLNLINWPKYLKVNYSYAFENNNKWNIVVNEGKNAYMYQTRNDGLLTKVPVPWSHRIHIAIYRITEMSLYPLLYLSYLTSK